MFFWTVLVVEILIVFLVEQPSEEELKAIRS
jgi:hypothetical protein